MNRLLLGLALVAVVLGAAAVAQDPLTPITPSEEPILLLAQKPSRNMALLSPANEQAEPRLQQSMPTLQLARPLSWEYKVVPRSGPLPEHELNMLGRDHWELITVTLDRENMYMYIFKRVGPVS